MVLVVVGIATTAAGAMVWYSKVQGARFGEPGEVVRTIRQTTGVVLAVANFIRSILDALQLVNRPAVASATTTVTGRRIIGAPAGSDD